MDIVNNKELPILRYIIEAVREMRDEHEKGEIYFRKELTSIAYGWHNTKFPPEYREYILTGNKGNPVSMEYDLYYLYMEICERVHGAPLPLRLFLRGGVWQELIRADMAGWPEDLVSALLILIRKCTARRPRDRIIEVENMVKTEEWMVIEKRYKEYQTRGFL